jgi:hypothetical protein
MLRWMFPLVAMAACVAVSAQAPGGGQGFGLEGVQKVFVVIDLEKGLAEAGLTEGSLRQELEELVGAAGLTVLPLDDPLEEQAGQGVLRLAVQSRPISENNRIYSVRLEFRQRVRLERNPEMKLSASTWSAGDHGMTPLKDMREIRSTVRDLAGRFAADYRKANPKQTKG